MEEQNEKKLSECCNILFDMRNGDQLLRMRKHI